MLRVKRASAGSGKTYELAKIFIKLLITSQKQGLKKLLKKDDSFKESLSSVMAVTFTVKATAEMKQRIVETLADLAAADTATPEKVKSIDYLDEFIKDFNSNVYEIAELSRCALRTLLLNYSDFKVQTIDSFFQGILHTFAYEANLDDAFNTEINTDFVTSQGFDSALDEISAGGWGDKTDKDSLHWLKIMMEDSSDSTKWNVFTRDEGKKSLYKRLIDEAKNLEKEEYQKIKEELNNYFSSLERPFNEIVAEVDDANLLPIINLYEKRREKAIELKAALIKAGIDETYLANYNSKPLRESLKEFDRNSIDIPSKEIKGRKAGPLYSLSKAGETELRARLDNIGDLKPSIINDIDSAFNEWMEAANRYRAEFESAKSRILTWMEYKSLLNKLMLVMEIARRKDMYLKATNSLQISDTSQILSRIIGKEDAPFIYERMGSRLSHYLIDEFQDTSGLQWQNLKPLLEESESNGNENLIIGDAKQSIYRFRNANHTIISNLEYDFNDIVYHTTEMKPDKENQKSTNFRSKRNIVEFNNFIFHNILDVKKSRTGEPVFTPNIVRIYQDCVQELPENKKNPNTPGGFVEIKIYSNPGISIQEDEGEEDDMGGPGFAELPNKILELTRRGYSFRDIGILVKSHEQGGKAMAVISQYNESNPENVIPVISEEDLLVASALSIKIIIHALEIAGDSTKMKIESHPSLPEPVDPVEVMTLMRSLNSLSLSSVVEAIAGRFIPETRRDAEAPFIAAFQDAVMDYCVTHPGDIASFLKWWKQKSRSLSIVSPEDSEGVTIQTIHKAKGLEYPCVIIPEANFSFDPGSFTEWRWVKTAGNVNKSELLPPILPVLTSKRLLDTAHSEELIKYYEEFALDELNKMYVGFTRAGNELYIYIPVGKIKNEKKAGGAILSLFDDAANEITDDELLSETLFIEKNEEDTILRYGQPLSCEEIKEEKIKEAEKKGREAKETIQISSYENSVSQTFSEMGKGDKMVEIGPTALFRNDHPLKTIIYPDGTEEEMDPRMEGTYKHKIMQMIEVPSDLDKALLRLKVEGFISPSQVETWGKELRRAIESVEERGWFSHDNIVYNERPLIKHNTKTFRPDRFFVTPDNDAVIIDYKFGEKDSSYKKQISDYKHHLLATRNFMRVKAYLWYVSEGEIEEI